MNKRFFTLVFGVTAMMSACGSVETGNTNSNTNTAVAIDPANIPEGLSTTPLPPSTNSTPGIPPANAVNAVPKGATPTPGIPDEATRNKPFKPGATPTPGIPDQETIRRQMKQPTANVNDAPVANGEMMMRSRKRPQPTATP